MSMLGALFLLGAAATVIEKDGKKDRRAYPKTKSVPSYFSSFILLNK